MGRQIVKQLERHGVEVWGLGRTGRTYVVDGAAHIIDRARLDETLPAMDLLVMSSALTTETEGIIGAAQVALLKSDAIVINVSRGQLIDQDALVEALRNNRIAGACLDVFEVEPLPKDSPLWDLDNVIVSPHSASTVRTENEDLVRLFLENLDHLRQNEPLRNVYDRTLGY
jgi:glyoxylate/hydroxypyruvate reductase A